MDDVGGIAVASQLAEGQALGDYEILSVAGSGGMGLVYKARQRSLGRIVALKVIRDDIARVKEYRDRFLREARLAASVDHPNVVSVYDVAEYEGQLYLAMHWIEGEDLKHQLAREGRLPADQAVAVATQLAGALDAVHSVGLIHRDVKPANVLLRQIGGNVHAYLSDFGVAKPSESSDALTKTGWVVGTAGYLSPEQIRGLEAGPSSDFYALGCVFFEALTGRAPFTATNEMALRWAHANDPRPVPSTLVPGFGTRFDAFVATALATEPERRFRSGQEFAASLAATGAIDPGTIPLPRPAEQPHAATAIGPPTPVPPPNTPPPAYPQYAAVYGYGTPPPPQRSGNPLALIVLGLVALAGIAAGALAAAGVFSHNPPTPTHRAANTPATTVHPTPHTLGAHHTQSSSVPTGAAACGPGLWVAQRASCGFARNVRLAYDQTSGGNQSVTAYSPDTGSTYTIVCNGGDPHFCTGGTTIDASIYFTSSSGSTAPSGSPPSGAPSGCNCTVQNLPVQCGYGLAGTSGIHCGFANNVFYEYWQASGGDPSLSESISAWSRHYGVYVSLTCIPAEGVVDCLGPGDRHVLFTQADVTNYSAAAAARYAVSGKLGPNG